jgi:hypothetical protein
MGTKEKTRLCKLADKNFIKKKFNEYADLVSPPGYICRKCGRAAVSDKNLCKPKKIKAVHSIPGQRGMNQAD